MSSALLFLLFILHQTPAAASRVTLSLVFYWPHAFWYADFRLRE
jgi:hypothetical protein